VHLQDTQLQQQVTFDPGQQATSMNVDIIDHAMRQTIGSSDSVGLSEPDNSVHSITPDHLLANGPSD